MTATPPRPPSCLPQGPNTGCPETWRRYLRIGINTNRICCSMPTEYMMDAADEVGFMLMPEGVTWGNGLSRYHDIYTPQTVREMARLCRNHPSVVRYSLTNEVGGPVGKDWPWRALIDAILEEDDTRPLVYELVGCGMGRIDGVRRGHAYIDNHYGNIDKGGDFIRSMGEHFWETDGMAAFAIGAQQLRLYDWAYFAPWSWINYWPNFLEGMSHEQHAWKANNGPDRKDGVNGWGSPIVRFVQRGLHPYLLVDHEILKTNPPRKRVVGDGQIQWPYRVPRYVAGDSVERRVEVFHGGLSGNTMSLKWTAHWDTPEGPVALAGAKIGPFDVKPGFHVTQAIRLTVPVAGNDNRRLYLVMESLKDNVTVYREDRVFFNVAATGVAAEPAALAEPRSSLASTTNSRGTGIASMEQRALSLSATFQSCPLMPRFTSRRVPRLVLSMPPGKAAIPRARFGHGRRKRTTGEHWPALPARIALRPAGMATRSSSTWTSASHPGT